jgi:cytochrome c2
MISEDQKIFVHPEIKESRKSKNYAIIVWISGLSGILASTLFFLGFEVGIRKLFPYGIMRRIDGKIERLFFSSASPERLTATQYHSTLVRLVSDVGTIDIGRTAPLTKLLAQNGGGLTSFGDDVLVLPYNGKIYAASSASDIKETNIAAPDNNRAAYQSAADLEEFKDYAFHKENLRYNDILFFESEIGRGLIASYTEYHPDRHCYTNTLAKLVIDADVKSIHMIKATPGDWKVVYRTSPCLPFKNRYLALEGHMAGGRIVFEKPSTVYLTSGDFHIDGMRSEGPGIAQEPDAQYGKVLAIDIESGDGRIISMGHRNMQGVVLDDASRLLVIEHGPRGGDELNLIIEGSNYGWPLESYGTTYRGMPIPNSVSLGRHETFNSPIFAWVPSIAASGITRVDGFHEAWDGDFLVSSLRDRSLYRIRMEGDRVIYSERIEIGARIRYVHLHTNGQIVLWTDNQELIFLTAMDRSSEAEHFGQYLERADLSASMKRKLQTAMDRCTECHSLATNDHALTPSLNRIFGDPIASTPFAGYSPALDNKSGRWTRQSLVKYIANPQAFAPGTTMPTPQIDDPKVINEVINYLEDLDKQY